MQTTFWTSRLSKAFHLSHYDNTSAIPGATLEKRQKAVNKENNNRTRKLDSELNGLQKDQSGPIESELNEYGHGGRVFVPRSLADTGVLPPTSASFWTSSLRKWLANTRHFSQRLVPTEAYTQMGSRNCSGMGDSFSESPEGLRCSPLLCGRKLFF